MEWEYGMEGVDWGMEGEMGMWNGNVEWECEREMELGHVRA